MASDCCLTSTISRPSLRNFLGNRPSLDHFSRYQTNITLSSGVSVVHNFMRPVSHKEIWEWTPLPITTYLRNMVTPVSMNCFWMVFHDCTSTITSRSVRGWTGRSTVFSRGPAPLSVLDLTTSSTLDLWRRRDLRQLVVHVQDAGAHRRNGLEARSHAKQHIAPASTDPDEQTRIQLTMWSRRVACSWSAETRYLYAVNYTRSNVVSCGITSAAAAAASSVTDTKAAFTHSDRYANPFANRFAPCKLVSVTFTQNH